MTPLRSRRAAGCCVALATLWLLGTPAAAEAPEELFERGNSAYAEGRFDDAAQLYREVLRFGIEDPLVEYNLGNAEFRGGRLGRAILHFERARRLDPTDADTRANLELAQSLTADRVEAPPVPGPLRWLRGIQDRLGPDRQAWIGLGLVWLVAALVARCFARPGGWTPAAGWTLAVIVLALATVAGSWYATYQRVEGRRLAVVQQPVVEVLAGPGVNNASLFTVHEGLTVEIRSERQEWIQVSLPNGLNGWVDRAALEPV